MARFQRTRLEDLPDEVLTEILVRVPALSLTRHRFVCHRWRSIIDDKQFAVAQHERALMGYPSLLMFFGPNKAVWAQPDLSAATATAQPRSKLGGGDTKLRFLSRICGSSGSSSVVNEQVSSGIPLSLWRMPCYQWHLGLPGDDTHGCALRCYRSHLSLDRVVIVVLNPVTRNQVELPPCPSIHGEVRFWIGFDLVSGFYKVVLATQGTRCYEPLVIIHTVGKDRSWRWLDATAHEPLRTAGNYGDPVYYRGRLHWKALGSIHVLDLATEETRVLGTPETNGDLLVMGRSTFRTLAFIAQVDEDSTRTASTYRTWVLDEAADGVEPVWNLWGRGDIEVPKNLCSIGFLSSLSDDILLVRCPKIQQMITGKCKYLQGQVKIDHQELSGLACYNVVTGTLSCLEDHLPHPLVTSGRLHRYFLLHPSLCGTMML